MSIWRRFARLFERRSTLANPDSWLVEALGGRPAKSGAIVNEQTALQASAVYACVRVLAETVASLPLPVYRRLRPRGKERAPDHPLYRILHDSPNPEMTSFEFRETLMGHLLLWGNAYAEIERDAAGRVVNLWPLRPDRMAVRRDNLGLRYEYTLPDGTTAVLRQPNILHIRGLSPDGIVGYSPIRLAREAIGLALATEEFGARFFSNGARPGGILTHPKTLGDQALKHLREQMESLHSGLTNSHRLMILEEGMTYTQVGIPPEDAQFLQTRKFQVNEIARIFRVPPHLIGDLERATFSNIEHQSIEFVVHTIRPWLVRWEQAILRDLFSEDERREYFAEFVVDGLLRGDTESRYRAYAVGRQWGWLSANDVRELENLNPVPGGDVYLVPLNMVPADTVVAKPQQELDGQPTQERSLALDREERARRAAGNRRQLAARFRSLFRSVEERIVKREVAEVRRAAERYLLRRDVGLFIDWLERFYLQDHREFMRRNRLPVYTTLADMIAAAAAEEIGAEGGLTPELQRWLDDYLSRHISLHTGSALGQLRQILAEASKTGQDPLPAIEQRLAEWEERRPAKIAERETVQLANAVAREVWMSAGVQRVRWHAYDECPYCLALDGRVVDIRTAFLPAGVDWQPDGADKPLRSDVDVHHPPAHGGCDCFLSPAL